MDGIPKRTVWAKMLDNYYYNHICEIFSIAKNNVVLEFGSFRGWHTSALLECGAKKIIAVEPNKHSFVVNNPIYSDPRVEFHSCTANDYYKNFNEQVDVVTCMGLLYHLHSPLHLIEQILNISKPKYFIVETIMRYEDIKLSPEPYNVSGYAHSDTTISTPLKYNIVLDINDLIPCICSVGYELIHQSTHLNEFTTTSKTNIGFAIFKKVDL